MMVVVVCVCGGGGEGYSLHSKRKSALLMKGCNNNIIELLSEVSAW